MNTPNTPGHSASTQHTDAWSRYRYADNVPVSGLLIDGRPALTQVDPQGVGRYVLMMVRDPLCAYDASPAQTLAERLEDAELVGRSGMFTTYSGTYKGARISIIESGSGGPEVEVALMELFEHTEADTFIRVGGSGGMNAKVSPGDVVIATGVVRDEGLSASYVPASYPAASTPDVVLALAQGAADLGISAHLGLTRSTDSDFVGGGRPGAKRFFQPEHLDIVERWSRVGVLNGDRESAAVVTLAQLYGLRGGSICSVADNIVTGATFQAGAGHEAAQRIALEGVAILHEMDRRCEAAGLSHWIPRLGVDAP